MYKLLLVTDQPKVNEAFMNDMQWESLGFREPRVVSSARSAMESLQKHHADGIAVSLAPEEQARLLTYLTQSWPLLPIMRASSQRNEVYQDVQELSSLLTQVHADNADERYDEAEAMQSVRHSFFRKLLDGSFSDRDAVRRRLQLLRSRMNPDAPCVMIEFSLPDDTDDLSGRWQYGPERLEIAMRNFFGAELEGMRLLVSVLPGARIYLLACPMLGNGVPGEERSMTGIVASHTEDAIAHVREYLGIEMQIADIKVLPTVTALADPMGE